MKQEENGWVIVCVNHPVTKTSYIIGSSFSYTRKDAIESFVHGSGQNWYYWNSKYNFKAVKATRNIEIIT